MSRSLLFWLACLAVSFFTHAHAAQPTSDSGPAIAWYEANGGRERGFYVAFQAADRSNNVHISKLGERATEYGPALMRRGYRSSVRLPSRTSATPALAEFRDKLWMVFAGTNSKQNLYFQSFDGDGWTEAKKLSFRSSSAPAVTVINDRLALVYRGRSGKKLYHANFDGEDWSVAQRIPIPEGAKGAPSIAEFNGELHLVYRSAEYNNVVHMKLRDGQWETLTQYLTKTGKSPSIVKYPNSADPGRDQLVLALAAPRGDCAPTLFRLFDQGQWKSVADPNKNACGKPGLAYGGGKIILALNGKKYRMIAPAPLEAFEVNKLFAPRE